MKNRSRIALLIVALFMLGTGTITAYQSLSKTVAIVEDGKVTQFETLNNTVEDILTIKSKKKVVLIHDIDSFRKYPDSTEKRK